MTLKKDGRRVSLEGVLTGAAFGILLIYLFDQGVQAAEMLSGRAPLPEKEPLELGDLATRSGRIQIAPLEEVNVGPLGLPRRPPVADAEGPTFGPGGGISLRPLQRPGSVPLNGPEGLVEPLTLGGSIDAGQGRSTPQPPEPPEPPEPPGPPRVFMPGLVLVVVRSDGGQGSSSVEGSAISSGRWRQVGISDSKINIGTDAGQNLERGVELRSERLLPVTARSQLQDADLDVIAEHVGLLRTTLLGGAQVDYAVLGARDLLQLGAQAREQTTTKLNSSTTGLDSSRISLNGGNDQLGLESLAKLVFTGVGDSHKVSLSFDLLTQAMKDSQILMGTGNDSLTINSGFFDSISDLFNQGETGGGLVFKLADKSLDLCSPASQVDFSLNATAIGLNNSLIDCGSGDDRLSILTRIDSGDLSNDLQPIVGDDSQISVNLTRIGLLNSTVVMGEGNDVLRVSGQVINSTIDMGRGRNSLILEQAVDAGSRIILGDGGSDVSIQRGLGGQIEGGPGDDTFSLGSTFQVGEIDGGGGNNILSSNGSIVGSRDLLVVNRPDGGNLGGTRFRNIQTIGLGNDDDVAIMDLNSTLTGRLLGGNGLDRLEFSEWQDPVSVDLDLGSATGIYGGLAGGISGFEQAIGGLGNDLLVSSCAQSGIDGGLGDDFLYLRWNPWQSPNNQGLQLVGGQGRDLFVFDGLENDLPASWDGSWGLPRLMDLDLLGSQPGSPGIGLSDQIAWVRKQVLPNGVTSQSLQRLTPSGIEGLGNARMLPVAPLDQLLAGMSDSTVQLAIAVNPAGGGTLELLGKNGRASTMAVARIESNTFGNGGPAPPASAPATGSLSNPLTP